MEKIRTVIVDDELHCLSALKQLIAKYCPDVVVSGTASSVREAIVKIQDVQPQLVFMDIRMPDGDGFQVLERVEYNDFEVIFTTAHKEYALKAFEFSAIHYLLKPVGRKALQEAISRYTGYCNTHMDMSRKIRLVKENIASGHKKIILPVSAGFEIYETADIIRCQGEGAYTEIFIRGQDRPVIVSQHVGHYEELLVDQGFARVHKKHLVNLNFVSKFMRSGGGYLLLSDGSEIIISDRRKAYFQQRLKDFARGL
ncbi:MAG: response regulator transcription factor [Bacteroidales bacterium]|nr:response regulator transcription factor [Bacteroidales bacterium]